MSRTISTKLYVEVALKRTSAGYVIGVSTTVRKTRPKMSPYFEIQLNIPAELFEPLKVTVDVPADAIVTPPVTAQVEVPE